MEEKDDVENYVDDLEEEETLEIGEDPDYLPSDGEASKKKDKKDKKKPKGDSKSKKKKSGRFYHSFIRYEEVKLEVRVKIALLTLF